MGLRFFASAELNLPCFVTVSYCYASEVPGNFVFDR
jgi:hypothetical protein